MLTLFISTHDWYSFDFFVMFQCNNKNYLADGEKWSPRPLQIYVFAYCFCYLCLLLLLLCCFSLKKNMNIAYAFSDFYQHVKSGQTVPKCIDIKYFYI